ncbi:MAG: hypothetical protein D4R73_06150 [Deltaproteobacteria bacterium]|jgi:hypothetical protein|nr:MAG: hypothetical protein D4R73_06150 [Deltaproteobacteria bacterium]
MKDQNEIRLAWQLWNLTSGLNDLLWDRYGDEFIDIHLTEEDDRYVNSIDQLLPSSVNPEHKTAK